MLGFQSNGLADLVDRIVVGLIMVLAVLFSIGALVILLLKSRLF
jgi:hypothetical protein